MTYVTLMWLYTRMRQLMPPEIASFIKLFETHIASIWFAVRVSAFVPGELVGCHKRFIRRPTDVTFVWSIASMCKLVPAKNALISKSFVTHITIALPFPSM